MNIAATSLRSRATVSISWEKATPSTTIGMVPRMTYHPSRAEMSPRSSGWNSERVHVPTIRMMSARK